MKKKPCECCGVDTKVIHLRKVLVKPEVAAKMGFFAEEGRILKKPIKLVLCRKCRGEYL